MVEVENEGFKVIASAQPEEVFLQDSSCSGLVATEASH